MALHTAFLHMKAWSIGLISVLFKQLTSASNTTSAFTASKSFNWKKQKINILAWSNMLAARRRWLASSPGSNLFLLPPSPLSLWEKLGTRLKPHQEYLSCYMKRCITTLEAFNINIKLVTVAIHQICPKVIKISASFCLTSSSHQCVYWSLPNIIPVVDVNSIFDQ